MNEENLVIRLKRFMENEGITSTQLADKAGMPRPSLSQILSGRNKKVSDVIITQLHKAYPKLSIQWLLFGEGPMMLSDVVDPLDDSDFYDPLADGQMFQENANVSELSVPSNGRNYAGNQQNMAQNNVFANAAEIANLAPKGREIVSITVFFDDNSFETFTQGKK